MGRLFNTKHIIYFNHGVPFLGYQGFTKLILYIIEKVNLLLTDEILTVSNNMRFCLKKLTQKKVSIIYNGSASGINLFEINKIKKRFPKRKKGEFNIGYIGRPNKRKGYNFTIELWKQYFANKKEYKLFIYGSPKIKESRIKNIFPMGFKNNMYESYSHLDCVILPSLHEGLSYTAIESCAFYCPVIANNIPGIQEIIKNKKNGFLINQPTLEKYASSIILTKNIICDNFPNKDLCDDIARKYDRKKFLKYYSIFLNKKFNN
jgi:glycosyltransferase involved in cell wall biosynthesis